MPAETAGLAKAADIEPMWTWPTSIGGLSLEPGPLMRLPIVLIASLLIVSTVPPVQAADPTRETILFVRHGEKGPAGLGQLSCRGLNRALALPAVLKARYGRVDAVFAPDPSHSKEDSGIVYDYVRPLATVEPSAIRFGLPVHVQIGFEEGAKLRAALLAPEFHARTVLVGWEHHMLDAIVPALLTSVGGDARAVPDWPNDDFDSIWRVTIAWTGETGVASFAHEEEGLDGQPDLCPNAAAPPLVGDSPLVLEHK